MRGIGPEMKTACPFLPECFSFPDGSFAHTDVLIHSGTSVHAAFSHDDFFNLLLFIMPIVKQANPFPKGARRIPAADVLLAGND